MWTPQTLTERAPTVLVADRTDLLRRNVAAHLQRAGYEVLQASDGREALAVLARARPDAALFDSGLPDVSGADLCRIAKGQLGLQHAYLVLVASSEDIGRSHLLLGTGASEVLHKPLELDLLTETLNETLVPLPRPGQVLTLRALGTDRSCHVSAWRSHRRQRLTLEPGPEYEWLGGDQLRGVPIHVTYPGPHGVRLTLQATLRRVTGQGFKHSLDLILAPELPRRAAPLEGRHPALGVKYASYEGAYEPAIPYNVSVTGLRLGGVRDSFVPDEGIELFFFQQHALELACRGVVKSSQEQDGRHFEVAIALHASNDEQRHRLIALLKPGCLAPPAL